MPYFEHLNHSKLKSEIFDNSVVLFWEWIESAIDEYFEGKHLQPFVVSENFKFIISSTVDTLLKLYDATDTCKDEDWNGIDDDF